MQRNQSGFTLLENLIIVCIIATVGAIGLPTWNGFMNRAKVSSAIGQIHSALMSTKNSATTTKVDWQFSVRSTVDGLEYAIHPKNQQPVEWKQISGVRLDTQNTTFYRIRGTDTYRMQFDWTGAANGQLGRVAVRAGGAEKCVIVSTLLGAMRLGKGRPSNNHRLTCN